MLPFDHSSPAISLLYVEDDPYAREKVVDALTRNFPGLTVYPAEDGAAGLKLCRELRPEIVLTDIEMPALDGIEMAREILSFAPGTRVIIISSHSKTDYLFETMRLGIRHYLTKPLDFRHLFNAVGECLSAVQLERQVRRQEECIRVLSQVVEQNSRMVAVSDREGKIVYVNDTFCKTAEQGAQEILGKGLQELSPLDPERFREVWKAVSSGAEWHGEWTRSRKSGEVSWELASISPLFDSDKSICHFVTIAEDITARKKRQEELERVQRLESLGAVAGGIAHDFNNILTGILGNISFAQALAGDNHAVRPALEDAEKASLRAADLARQLLTFANGGKPVKKRVSVRHLLEQAISLALGGSSVRWELQLTDEVDGVEVDPAQIQQAFRNILVNAVEANPGGEIVVNAGNISLPPGNAPELPAGSYVRISFSDRGCGIPEKEQQRIFDPYFTTKPGGTGLGLTSAHSIVMRHGGHIAVDSSPARGTTFTCYLPSTGTAYAPAESKPRKEGAQAAGGAVLVMDDESVVRKVTGKMLQCLGYEVTTCNNGEEAIELYRKAQGAGDRYKAVIMDLTVMGGMGGKEAAEHILRLDPEARLVVSSGYFDDPVLADYREHGFCAVLPKPYKSSDLAEVINNLDEAAARDGG
ncbi:response regulator [Geomonas sp. RF6]|uniref:response regulator n=1 Tax=Geomonas sp. RF6 TaxID=2897342 RepID=UPI001E4C7CD8|nr:response regulator [Geomonas sp. RF6]UFS70926.1 response regulator [Geomonas sp. RF6]